MKKYNHLLSDDENYKKNQARILVVKKTLFSYFLRTMKESLIKEDGIFEGLDLTKIF